MLDPRHRRQLELEGRSRTGGEHLEKRVGQRSSKAGRDRDRESGAVHAEAECDGLVEGRRTIDRDQAFGEHAREDEFAVDQYSVTIEDDEIGHAAPFALEP